MVAGGGALREGRYGRGAGAWPLKKGRSGRAVVALPLREDRKNDKLCKAVADAFNDQMAYTYSTCIFMCNCTITASIIICKSLFVIKIITFNQRALNHHAGSRGEHQQHAAAGGS